MFGFPKVYGYIAIALILAGLVAAYKVDRYQYGQSEYKRGIREVEEAQALVIAKVKLENEKRETAIKLESVRLQTELEGKHREAELVASSLRDKLSLRRVCLDEVRADRVPKDTATTGPVPSAADNTGPIETIGERVIAIVQACQNQTDALVAGQSYFRGLKANGF